MNAGETDSARAGEGIVHKELSYRIVGCAQKVHRALGPGFPEGVYHRALSHELVRAAIPFETEKAVEVFYEGVLCGQFKPDLLVAEKAIVELKALKELNGDHVAQALAYLKATNLNLAVLINFGRSSLETRRVVL